MAGKVLFEEGPHQSRNGFRGEITQCDWKSLRSAAPDYVSDGALTELANKIMLAEADAERGDAYVATRHQLAQLRKLKRIAKREKHVVVDMTGREHPFAELADALANLDQGTLELIQAANRGAIRAIVDRDGVFVDADEDEHRLLPPTIQITRPFTRSAVVRGKHPACSGDWPLSMTPASVWFPRGVEGFVESVEEGIAGLEMLQDDAGRREKPWQDALAKVVVEFWQTHCPSESQSAHRDRSIADYGSRLVEFGRAVYGIVGSQLSAARISNLLNTHG
jgi:hypothetical protein